MISACSAISLPGEVVAPQCRLELVDHCGEGTDLLSLVDLLPDGTMSRDAGGLPLAFTAFSAGEKMVARLMMRLTTLLVTTKVPFCWVDEPLEHLDPRSRHLVGSMLAHLSATPGLEQVFVTTYEEPLARRLAEFQPGRVRVEYLRAEHVG